jgi:16S rRNA processing protein RimM
MTGSAGHTIAEKGQKRSSGNAPELRYLAIGQVARAHGLRGELSVVVLTEFPERFETTSWVYLGSPLEATPYRLKSYRWHKSHILLTLVGINNRTDAEKLKGQLVQVPLAEAVPLPEGVYYFHQMIGLEVVTTAGQRLGVVIQVLETGANEVYVVDQDGREILLPAIADVVKTIDIEQGQMVVELIDGLL